jgi:hypothetical protein
VRRFFLAIGGVLLAFFSSAPVVRADGLYVGHGQRSDTVRSFPWAARLNFGGGFHGVSDPYPDEYGFSRHNWYDFGGYGTAGLEIHLGHHNSFEAFGLYREVNNQEVFRSYYMPPELPSPQTLLSEYHVEAWSAGGTIRHYAPRGRSALYFGFGGGYVDAKSSLLEVSSGTTTLDVQSRDEGPEAHFLVGAEGLVGDGLALSLEMGYRHTWLDKPNRFNGAFIGARLGFLIGK